MLNEVTPIKMCANCKVEEVDPEWSEELCEDCNDDYENGDPMNASYYDDDPFDDNDRDLSYARLLQQSGVEKKCCYCGCSFVGMPDHGVCSSCADKIEQGWDLEEYDPEEYAREEAAVREAERLYLISWVPFRTIRSRAGVGGNRDLTDDYRNTIKGMI